jgi:hypothetical protein
MPQLGRRHFDRDLWTSRFAMARDGQGIVPTDVDGWKGVACALRVDLMGSTLRMVSGLAFFFELDLLPIASLDV